MDDVVRDLHGLCHRNEWALFIPTLAFYVDDGSVGTTVYSARGSNLDRTCGGGLDGRDEAATGGITLHTKTSLLISVVFVKSLCL